MHRADRAAIRIQTKEIIPMTTKIKRSFAAAGGLFLLFALLTAAVLAVDVRPIGPEGSRIGLAALNGAVFAAIGTNAGWDLATDLLGAAALLTAVGFAGLGLWQLARRRSLARVDGDLLLLGGVYLLAALFYLLFECFTVNFRPILVEGALEAAFPSSHTLLVVCILSTAILQLRRRLARGPIRAALSALAAAGMALTAVGRLCSGMHWLTDILGGILLGLALTALYAAAAALLDAGCTKARS